MGDTTKAYGRAELREVSDHDLAELLRFAAQLKNEGGKRAPLFCEAARRLEARTAPEPTPESDLPYAGNHGPEDCYGECPEHRYSPGEHDNEHDNTAGEQVGNLTTSEEREGGERRVWIDHGDAVEAVAALLFDSSVEDEYGEEQAWAKARRDAAGVLSAAESLRPTAEGEPVGEVLDDVTVEFPNEDLPHPRVTGPGEPFSIAVIERVNLGHLVRLALERHDDRHPRTDRPEEGLVEAVADDLDEAASKAAWMLENGATGEQRDLCESVIRIRRHLRDDGTGDAR